MTVSNLNNGSRVLAGAHGLPMLVFAHDTSADELALVDSGLFARIGASVPSRTVAEYFELICPDDREAVRQAWKQLDVGSTRNLVYRLREPSLPEEFIWVLETSTAEAVPNGVMMRGVVVDFSGRREAELRTEYGLERCHALADQSWDWTWSADARGVIREISKAAQVEGFSLSSMLGKQWSHVVHEDDSVMAKGKWETAILTGEAFHGRFRVRRVDGSWRHLHTHAVPIQNRQGRIIEWIGAASDVTIEEEAMRTTARLAAIVSSSDDAIIGLTVDGVVTDWNKGAERMFGYSAEEAVEQDIGFLAPAGQAEKWAETRRRIVHGERQMHGHVLQQTKAGEVIHTSVALSPIKEGEGTIRGLSLICRDVTLQYAAEQRLQAAKATADAATRAKSAFLATMSHEIRTPLNGILGMAELLEKTSLDARQRRYLDIVRSSSSTLLTLINDILDFSKIEAERLTLESVSFDLHKLIEDVVDTFARQAMSKSLELVCQVHPNVPRHTQGDPMRLRQVLTNLVGNAVKFTSEGYVRVIVTGTEHGSTMSNVRMAVQDSGIGIESDRLQRLFEPFAQEDVSTTRKYGGTGLGLSISRRLVELMGGTMAADSHKGRGSTFWCEIPMVVDASSTHAAGVAKELRSLRVLLVEAREDGELQPLKPQLESWGMRVTTTSNVEDAKTKIYGARQANLPFAVALIDLDGEDVGAELRGFLKEVDSLLATIAVVSLGDVFTQDRLKMTGLRATVERPVKPSRLLDAISETIFHSRPPPVVQRPPREILSGNTEPSRQILLAEDNEINQIVATEILATGGYGCNVVRNGREAVEEVQTGKYGLVLMDCLMPEMDGFEAAQAIRKREREQILAGQHASHIPIVALTANAIRGDRERCIEAGMDGYITKPIDAQQLLETVGTFYRAATPPVIREAAESDENENAPIDITGLRRRCLGNDDLVRTLLKRFQEDGEGMIAEIEDKANEQDKEGLLRALHALKGASGNLSLSRLFRVAGYLEDRTKQGDIPGVTDQLPVLRGTFSECLAFVRSFLSEPGVGTTSSA